MRGTAWRRNEERERKKESKKAETPRKCKREGIRAWKEGQGKGK